MEKGVFEKQVEKYLINFYEDIEESVSGQVLFDKFLENEMDFETWWQAHIIDTIYYKYKNNKIFYGEMECVVSQAFSKKEEFFENIIQKIELRFFKNLEKLYEPLLYYGALEKTKDCKDFKDLENFIKKLENEKEKDIQKAL